MWKIYKIFYKILIYSSSCFLEIVIRNNKNNNGKKKGTRNANFYYFHFFESNIIKNRLEFQTGSQENKNTKETEQVWKYFPC